MALKLSALGIVFCGLTGAAQAFATPVDSSSPAGGSEPSSDYYPASDDEGVPPLLFGKSLSIGGYAGLDVAYSRMFGEDGAVVGLQGALLINHRLSLGLAGYGWTESQSGPADGAGYPQRFDTGYGGFTVHYSIFFDNVPVYLSLGTMIGGGAIDLHREDEDYADDDHAEDLFAVVQPDVSLYANLTPWMRLGITAGYRFASGVGRSGFDESDLNGPVIGGQLQFGRF
jgi:hypothetical protein